MGEMTERIRGWFGTGPKTKVVTPEGVGVNVKPFTPPIHFDQAKVMDRPTMPPTRPSTPDSAGAHQQNSHKGRKIVAGVVVAAAGTGGYLGYNALQNSTENTTPTPVTTIVDVTTPPLTSPETTTVTVPSTTEAPTTTVQEKPTDVIEDKGDYKILRNGGLLYEAPSLNVNGQEFDTSFFGGFEVHAVSEGKTFGLVQDSEGLRAQNTLLETVLWAFAYQDPQFVNPDGSVNYSAYVQFLQETGGIDSSVIFPEQEGAAYADRTATPSEPVIVNFSLPIVFSNSGPNSIEGVTPQRLFYIDPISNDDIQSGVAVTGDGQLIYFSEKRGSNGSAEPVVMKEHGLRSILTLDFGAVSAAIGNITHTATTPAEQLSGPYLQFLNPFRTEQVPNNFSVPDISKFVLVDLPNQTTHDRIFDVPSTT